MTATASVGFGPMSEPWAEQAGRVLRVLADLSPTGEQSAGGLTIPTDWFRWLPAPPLACSAPRRMRSRRPSRRCTSSRRRVASSTTSGT